MATFVVDAELVELLLEHGADPHAKISATNAPVVVGRMSSELEGVYKFIGGLTKREFDLADQRERLRVREILIGDQTATGRKHGINRDRAGREGVSRGE